MVEVNLFKQMKTFMKENSLIITYMVKEAITTWKEVRDIEVCGRMG